MKENFLHFISTTPCMLSINGKKLGTIDNDQNCQIDLISNSKNLFVTYEPISTDNIFLPYSIMLDCTQNPSTQNKCASVIPYPDGNFDVLLTPFACSQNADLKTLYSGMQNKYFLTVTSGVVGNISMFTGNNIVLSVNIPKIKNVKISTINDVILCIGTIDDENYHTVAISIKNLKTLFNGTCSSVSTDNNISIYSKLYSLCGHAKITTIDTLNSTVDEYYVYENNTPNNSIHPLLLPYAFLECVKYGDESFAKNILTANYSTAKITDFQNYFGTIDSIYFNRYSNNLSKLNYTIKNTDGVFKNYNFIMTDGKIADIEQVF